MKRHLKETGSKELDSETIASTKKMANLVYQLCIAAEKRAGALPYAGGFPYSDVIREAAQQVIRTKKLIRMISLGMVKKDDNALEEAKVALKDAQVHLKECQQC